MTAAEAATGLVDAWAVAASRPRLLLHDIVLDRSGPGEPLGRELHESFENHLQRIGPRPAGTSALIDDLEAAGLTGHGGAHVLAALKWRAALAAHGPLTVVANAAESEPLGGKDAALLRQRPHLVLDGLALAAEALGARRAVVWLHGDDDGTLRALQAALAERRATSPRHRLTEPWMEIVSGPAHYLAGEASAIGQAMAGHAPLPAMRRPGAVAAARTLVHNVETLARVALVARGHPPLRTTLLTVLTALDRQVVEVAHGVPATEVLRATGWSRSPQAVLLGGFGGLWAPWPDVARGSFDEVSLRAAGLTAGSGIIAPLARNACGVAETARVVTYLTRMGAGQCGPCLFGLPALEESLLLLAKGAGRRGELAQLLDDLRAIAGRGACHHPNGAVRLVSSALATFEFDIAEHAGGRPCGGSTVRSFPVPERPGR